MAELVGLWKGYGFYAKTYRQEDGCYNTVIFSPEYDTEEEALAFIEKIKELARG